MFNLDTNVLFRGALIFLRIGSLLFAMPFFGDSNVPVSVRILLSLSLTFGLYSLVSPEWVDVKSLSLFSAAFMAFKEALFGLVIGYLSHLIFDALVMAASLVGYQMGFGTSSLLFPGSETQMNSFTAFHRVLTLGAFISLGLYMIFINGIMETFEFVPAGKGILNFSLGELVTTLTSKVLVIAVQLATPVLVALLFATAALGILARTVPQLNVFTMSFPLNFFVGLITYLAMLPFFPAWLRNHYLSSLENIMAAVRLLGT